VQRQAHCVPGGGRPAAFDEHDLAEISHPDYPGERLIACRNTLLAADRALKREELLDATEALLAQIAARAQRGTLTGADAIGIEAGKVINTYINT